MKPYIIFLVLIINTTAYGDEIPCAPVESGGIRIDGLLGDWEGADGVAVDQAEQILKGKENWAGPKDLSFEVFCNYDEANLYLAINVQDEYFIRTQKAKGDDHLLIQLGGKQITIYPSNLHGIPGRMTGAKGQKVKGIQMAEALQPKGYSVELRVPWNMIPGYRRGISYFPGGVWVADSDSKAKMQTQTLMGTAPSGNQGRFAFVQSQAGVAGFLKERGYSSQDVRSQENADVVGDSRSEQVLLVGRTIGILGEDLPGGGEYFYLDLPVKQPKDVYWLKLMDLNGDGKKELLTRYTERNNYGWRDLIAVYRFNVGNTFVRSFAHEILKGQGKNQLLNRFTSKKRKRGPRKKDGVDLIFDQPVARGFSQETYKEEPATDCFPILLPWGEAKKQLFRFEGEEFYQK